MRHPNLIPIALAAPPEKDDSAKLRLIFKDLRVQRSSFERLQAMGRACHKAGARLMIVALPVNPSPQVSTPLFQTQQRQWSAQLGDFCREKQIAFCELSPVVNAARFYRDTHHLNADGQETATRRVTDWVKSS